MKKAFLLCAVMVVATGLVFGQPFKLTSVGGFGNVNYVLGPSAATEVISKGGGGFGLALGVGGKVRAVVSSMQNITWTGRLSFDVLQGKGGAGLGGPAEKTITQNKLGIGLGAEYGLKPMMMGAKEMKPYLGGEIQINIFPEATYEGYTVAGKGNSGTRIGLGFGGGIDYPLNEKLSLDVGLKFSLANLIGKGSTAADIIVGDNVPSTSLTEGTYMFLTLSIGVNFSLGAAPASGM